MEDKKIIIVKFTDGTNIRVKDAIETEVINDDKVFIIIKKKHSRIICSMTNILYAGFEEDIEEVETCRKKNSGNPTIKFGPPFVKDGRGFK